MTLDYFTLVLHYNGIMDGHSGRRKYIGGTVLVYDNMEIDLFSVQEIETMCKELGVYNYMQFYYVIPGCDLSDGLRYLSTDSHIIEMSKCLTPLNPKVDVYVEHETPNPLSMDKPIVIRDFSDRSDDDDVGIRLNDDGAGCSGYVDNGSDVCEHVNDDNNMFLDSDSDDVPFERLYDVPIHNQPSQPHYPSQPSQPHYPSQPSHQHYPNSLYPIISIDPIDDIPIGSDYGSSDQLNSPNNSDDEPHHIYPDFRATDLDDPVFTLGMYFRDNIELKEAVFAYRLKHGFGLRFTKNERWKVRVRCVEGCPWKLFAGRGDDGESFQINSFESVHTCSRAFHSRAVSSRWVAKKYVDHFRINPDMELDELIGKVMKDHEVELSRSKAYRAKQYAKVLIEGSYLEQYRRVRDYCEELMRTNPGTTAKVDVHVPGQQFKRLYVCLDGCKKGFLAGCRPIIGLDACHLKGAVAGQLLAAVGVDGNEGMYPIAYAVAEAESGETWTWFLENLVGDIGTGWCFVSDQQKGLVPAVKKVMQGSYHRFCVRHLFANFKKNHKGKKLKDLMWGAARASTLQEFDAFMREMEAVSKPAHDCLRGNLLPQWARHAFPHYPKCDMLLNNLCETFNSKIVNARTKPIITMLETIRRYLMTRIQKNRDAMLKYQGPICPRIQEKLQKCKAESKGCTPKWGGGNRYEVTSDGKKYIVDIVKKSCACNKWDLTGIPCKHAVRAISYKGHNAEDYVDDYFKKKTYLKVYSHLIQPCNGPDFWPIAAGDPVLPPIHRRQPGRPKRMHRRKDPDEHQNSHKLKRNQNSLKCGQCHQVGHNKRSCKKKQTMPAGVGQTEAREKGRKNVASSNKGNGKKRAGSTDVNFMGFKIPASVVQDETRAKGKKNMASSDKGNGKRGLTQRRIPMGFRVPIGMSSQQSNILGSPAAYNSSAPATSLEDTRSRTDIYGVQSSRDKQ
uniref:SWIM-type domain-containing protein n=1 Tax=Fagus sylvatica TaxID=28930 RepID=A0A2N9FZE3_FAGSY